MRNPFALEQSVHCLAIRRLMLLIVLAFLHATTLHAQTSLLSEYFDEAVLPLGWEEQLSGGPALVWDISPTQNAGGSSNELRAQGSSGFGSSRLLTPLLDASNCTDILITFLHAYEDAGTGLTFSLQTSQDGVNWYPESWSFTSGGGNWEPSTATASLTNFPGGSFHIGFLIEGDLSAFSAWYIDEVEVTATSLLPQCTPMLYPPDGAADIPLNMDLSWEYSWDAIGYQVFTGTDQPPTNILNGLDLGWNNTYSMTGLQPSTQYFWTIVPYNTVGLAEQCPVFSFTTLDPQPIPLEESFNSGSFPSGWAQQSFQEYPLWSVSETNYAGGDGFEMMANWTPGSGETRLITPPLQTAGISQLYLSFRYYFSVFAPGLTIKVQSSNDMVTWNDCGWEQLSENGESGPETVDLCITQDLGAVTYLAFSMIGDHYNFYFWAVDQVVISQLPPLPACTALSFPPDNSVLPFAGIDLQWENAVFATGYFLNFGTDNPPTNTASLLDLGLTTTYTLDNLLSGQTYFWSIIPYNSSGALPGCPAYSFQVIDPLTPPFQESFNEETIPAWWTQSSFTGPDLWHISATTYAGCNPNEIATYSYPGEGISRLILPPLNTVGLSSLPFSFYHALNGWGAGASVKVQTSSDLLQWNDCDWEYSTDMVSPLGPLQETLNLVQDIGNITFIAFVIAGDHSQLDYWFIDSIQAGENFNPPANCTDIIHPIDNETITDTSLELLWHSQEDAVNYLLNLGTDNPPANLLDGQLTGNDTSFIINGLIPGTTYYWTIKPIYDGGIYPPDCPVWSFHVNQQLNIFPWTETFDSSNEIPPGWQMQGEKPWVIRDSTWYGPFHDHGGNGNFTMLSDWLPNTGLPASLVTPPLDLSSLQHPKLRFYYQIGNQYYWGSHCYLHVDIWDGEEWIEDVINPLTNNIIWQETWVDLQPYQHDALQVRFRAYEDPVDVDRDIALDDILVMDTSLSLDCPQKQQPDTSGQYHRFVDFKWASVPNATAYLLYVGTDNPPTNLINGLVMGIPDSSFGFYQARVLLPHWDTSYYWNVAAYTSDDTSLCQPASFRTLPDPSQELPFTESFNQAVLIPPAWYELSAKPLWSVANTNWAGGNPRELMAYNPGGAYNDTARIITVPFNTQNNNELWLAFKHYFKGYGDDVALKIQTSSDLINWTDQPWSFNGFNGHTEPESVLVKLANCSGATTFLAFVVQGDIGDLYAWSIDDLHLFPALDHDVAVTYQQPENAFYSGMPYNPVNEVINYGNFQESFQLSLVIDSTYNETVNVTDLDPGQSLQVVFPVWNAQAGFRAARIFSSLPTDQWRANDTVDYLLEVYKARWTEGDSLPQPSIRGYGLAYQPDSSQAWLYATGGNPANNSCFSRYNVNTDLWEALPDMPFGVNVHSAAIAGEALYVIAGTGANDYLATDSVRKYHLPTSSWSTVAPIPEGKMHAKAVAYEDSLIYVAGGYQGSVSNKVFLYNTQTDSWRPATPLPGERFAGAFARQGNTLFYSGGLGSVYLYNTSFIGIIDSNDRAVINWQALSDGPVPDNLDNTWKVQTDSHINKLIINDFNEILATESQYPAGGTFRWDAAAWGDDGFIVTTGTKSYDWTPVNPNPCYIYHLSSDTWEKLPPLPVPVSGSLFGSFYLPGSIWKLVVASGYDGWGAYPGTQVLTDTMASPPPLIHPQVQGVLTYDNSGNTILPGCTLRLYLGNLAVDSTLSDSTGAYRFSGPHLSPFIGNELHIRVSSERPWGGGNAVDALLIMKHFVNMSPLAGIRLLAADVDNSGFVNSVDALTVMKRFVNMQNSFPAGNWVFDSPSFIIPATNQATEIPVKGICTGDVDGSYNPLP